METHSLKKEPSKKEEASNDNWRSGEKKEPASDVWRRGERPAKGDDDFATLRNRDKKGGILLLLVYYTDFR